MKCENGLCGKEFKPHTKDQRFCCKPCGHQSRRCTSPPKPRKHLRCHHCRGLHQTSQCPNRGESVRQFGTMDQDRNYVPPPGVKVRVLVNPPTINGDQLKAMLKEMP